MPDWWTCLDPKWQRLLVVTGVVVALVLLIYPFVSQESTPRRRGARDETIKQILTDKDVRSLGIDGVVAEVRTLAQRMDTLNRDLQQIQTGKATSMEENLRRIQAEVEGRLNELRELKEEVRRLASRAETAATPSPEAKDRERLPKEKESDQPTQSDPLTAPSPPKAPPPERQSLPKPGTVDRGTLAPGTLFQPPGLAGAGPSKIGELPPAVPSPGLLPAAAKAPASPPEIRVLRQTAATPEGEKSPDEAAKGSRDNSGPTGARPSAARPSKEEDRFLPVSIISDTLLTGMDAATGKGARADPIPILLRVKHEAILPNRFTVDIRECFLIASGYGDLSSERAYLRAENLSCVREDGGVIETTLEAYAVGKDGKAGIRGRLVSKQGTVLARAMQAGFLEAFASMFRQQPVATISTGRVERDVQYQSNLTPQAVGSAALAGVGSALDRLAQFYLDMAEDMFPVIEVDAGRQIDFIVHRGQRLTERAH